MRTMRAMIVGGALVLTGVALGAIAFRSERADAQTVGYRACVIGRQETHDIDGNGVWERQDRNFEGDRMIRIPPGWEVVGGGGAGSTPNVGQITICHR